MKRIVEIGVAATIVCVVASAACAQNRTNSTGTAPRNFSSAPTQANRSYSGIPGLNQANGTGITGGMDIGQLNSSAGTLTGAERALQGGQFIGADATDSMGMYGEFQQRAQSNNSARRRSTGNQRFQSGRFGNSRFAGDSFGESPAGDQRSTFRARLSVGFDRPTVNPSRVSRGLATRINGTDQIRRRTPITTEVSGGQLTIRGTVATESDRQLILQLVRLEPGVSQVVDQLVVR